MPGLTDYVDQLIRQILGAAPELMPHEADERLLWAVRTGLRTALGDEGWASLADDLPDMADTEERVSFQAGAVAGVGEALLDAVEEHVALVRDAIGAVIAYYDLAYDLELWSHLLRVWTAPVGTPVGEAVAFLREDRPELHDAILRYRPFAQALDAAVRPLLDSAWPEGQKWRTSERSLADWLGAVPLWLGRELAPVVQELKDRAGDPFDQGKVVGRVGARVVVEVILLALTVYDLAAAIKRGAQLVSSTARLALGASEQTAATTRITGAATTLATTGAAVSRTRTAAVRLYEELATDIVAYSRLSPKTGAFNKEVRQICGYSLSDVEYVKLRLDANHIVKGEMYDRWGAEMDRVFGWKRAEDMDAVALHTEWHIRSGEKLNTNLKLKGAERERSFSHMLDTHIATWQATNGQFTTLEQVFLVHQDFYRTYSPRLNERLQGWFDQRLAQIRAAGR